MIGPPPPTKVWKITNIQKEWRGKTSIAIHEHSFKKIETPEGCLASFYQDHWASKKFINKLQSLDHTFMNLASRVRWKNAEMVKSGACHQHFSSHGLMFSGYQVSKLQARHEGSYSLSSTDMTDVKSEFKYMKLYNWTGKIITCLQIVWYYFDVKIYYTFKYYAF